MEGEDHNLLCDRCLGEQAFCFYDDLKCNVLELCGSSSGFSWAMAKESRLDSHLNTNMVQI